MSEQKKTSWRSTLNKQYLAAPDLDDGAGGYIETVGTVSRISMEKVKNPMGETNVCRVAHFEENLKPLILNIGHCTVLEKFSGSRYLEDFPGTKVQMFVMLNQKSYGDLIDAVRFREQRPQEKEELTPEHPKWSGALEKCQADPAAITVVEKYFTISDDVRAKLLGK